MKELHVFGAVVHGFLVFGHALGLIYNVRQHNRVDTAIHGIALGYSFRSVIHHLKETRT